MTREITFVPSDNKDDLIKVETWGNTMVITESIGEDNTEREVYLHISDASRLIEAIKGVTE